VFCLGFFPYICNRKQKKEKQGTTYNQTNTTMKVLILQASPRANGNTAWMAEEYIIKKMTK